MKQALVADSMVSMRALSLLLPAAWLALSGCCHVNHLPGHAELLASVTVDVQVDAAPRPVFTRSRSHYQRRARGSIAEANVSASRFDDAIRSLLPSDLAQGVIDELPRAMSALLGHAPVTEGAASARLFVAVRDIQMSAVDAISPITWVWTGHARLEHGKDDVWRDCFEFRLPADFGGMEDFARWPSDRRLELVREAARQFARRLVERLAEEAGLAREGT